MQEEAFLAYLAKKSVKEEQAVGYITRLTEFQEFLKNADIVLNSIPQGKILEYTKSLVKNRQDTVLEFLRALLNYANFIEKYDYIIEVIDIAEAYNAMENLHHRVGEQYGKAVQESVFSDIRLPPLGVNPEIKSEVTKVVMRRLEEQLGEEKTIELLAPCLHGRPLEPARKDREDFLRLGDIDEFLKVKHQEMVERVQKHQQDGTLEYAQYIDEEVVAYAKNTPTLSPGIREGKVIISTKIPYQTKKYLNADNERKKRYYYCHCPWVRGAIKRGEEQEISKNFCHCSAGFTKKYWDVVFDQPTKVEPLETVLRDSLVCKFAIHIPKEFQK